MSFFGFVIAFWLFCHFNKRMKYYQRRGHDLTDDTPRCGSGAVSWHDEWHRQWARKFQRQYERRSRHFERHAQRRAERLQRQAQRWGIPVDVAGIAPDGGETDRTKSKTKDKPELSPEQAALARARRRAAAEAGFYGHLMSYLGVVAFLALINLFTTHYPWFIWPAIGWGIGIFSHYMAVFGSRAVKQRFFDPAVERELQRERASMQTEKQASIDELSATIAHEIRNPVAAAKSLVQQMGEDPVSVENVEYAKVALEELDRVEHHISHLLKYAKEEDYTFAPVNIAGVVDSALTQLRAKLDAGKVAVARNYIAGPTVLADAEKLRGVFVNVLDNAIDALSSVPEARRIDLFVENGDRRATVRVRDNGSGIPADKIERIFNPFFTTKEKGTGLGMAISKKIVEAHDGSIDVVSEAGRGTEFKITLPLPPRG